LHGKDGNLVARKRRKAKRRKNAADKRHKSGGQATTGLTSGHGMGGGEGGEGGSGEGGGEGGEGGVGEVGAAGAGASGAAGDTGGGDASESEGEAEFEVQEVALDFEHELYQLAADRQVTGAAIVYGARGGGLSESGVEGEAKFECKRWLWTLSTSSTSWRQTGR
jgi:hypothetical protein